MELYRDIAIDHDLVAGSLSNFPVYVDLTLGANVANANGYDVHFTTADGNTELDFELVSWDNTSKVWKGFVRVPSVSSSVDTVIRVYYGDSGITTDQSNPSTWDADFLAVYHLEEDPSGTNKDSTSNGYDLNANNNLVSGDLVSGKLGSGVRVGQSNGDYLRAGTPISVASGSDLTFSIWLYVNSWVGANPGLWRAGTSSTDNNFNIFQSTTGRPWIRLVNSSGDALRPSSGYGLPTGAWALVTYRITNGTLAEFLVNGVVQHTNAHSLATPAMSIYNIGYQSAVGERVDGVYDEIRFSKTVRSNNWLLTEYNNQNDPSSFYDLGSEQGGVLTVNPTDSTTPTDTSRRSVKKSVADTTSPNDSSEIQRYIIKALSAIDDGFENIDTPADTDPFNEGDTVSYTVQLEDSLPDGTYYWRVRAKGETLSDWSEAREFTIVTGANYQESPEDVATISDEIDKEINKPTSDLSTVTDEIAKGYNSTDNADEVAVDDEVSNQPGKTLDDEVSLGDDIDWTRLRSLAIDDEIEASDDAVHAVGANKADNTTPTDETARSAGKQATDAIELTDLLEKHVVKPIESLAEVIDAIQIARKYDAHDSVGTDDDVAKEIGSSQADAQEVLDSSYRAIVKIIADIANIEDATPRSIAIAFASAVTLTDVLYKAVASTKADEAEVDDESTRAVSKVLADAPEAEDQIASKQITKLLEDIATVTDEIAKALAVIENDETSATDAFAQSVGKHLADAIATTDESTRAIGKRRSESLSVSEHIVRAVGKYLADQILASDELSFSLEMPVIDEAITDDTVRKAIGKAIDGDAVAVSDVVVYVLKRYIYRELQARAAREYNGREDGIKANDARAVNGQSDIIKARSAR